MPFRVEGWGEGIKIDLHIFSLTPSFIPVRGLYPEGHKSRKERERFVNSCVMDLRTTQ
jgi:hypothetical protein